MPSIPDTLRTTAARCPHRIALVFGERSRTFRELAAEVEVTAAALAARNIRSGDRVLLLSANSDAFVVAAYAVLRAGAILVPCNPSSAAPELAHLISDSGASAVLHAKDTVHVVSSALELVDGAPAVLTLDALAELATGDRPPLGQWPAEFDDALLLYTSGTTGLPKGALFDHHRVVWVTMVMATCAGYRDGDRTVHAAPLYHAAALSLVLFPGIALAMTQIVLPRFDPTALLDVMEREQITLFLGVPTMYQFLLRQPDLATRELSSWRIGLFGAAPMSPDNVRALSVALPSVDLFQLCGQTEAGPGGLYCGPEDVRSHPDASGRWALPLTEARVVAPDAVDVEPGQVGELVLRGETVMKGYWNRPEATAEALRGGWLHTGDLALVDADGYVRLVDRLKDVIITGGRNVYSAEVEGALAGHPAVDDVAVVGIPHPDYGESIVAVVAPREGADPGLDELRAWAGERIATYKLPHRLLIEAVPRNASGKIQKHLLRETVRNALGATSA